jgi:hypothetical protein
MLETLAEIQVKLLDRSREAIELDMIDRATMVDGFASERERWVPAGGDEVTCYGGMSFSRSREP